MQTWPNVTTLEPKKMHNVRMPVELLTSMRSLADALPGWSVTDLMIIGSLMVAQAGSIPEVRSMLAANMSRPSVVMRRLVAWPKKHGRDIAKAIRDYVHAPPSVPPSPARGSRASSAPSRQRRSGASGKATTTPTRAPKPASRTRTAATSAKRSTTSRKRASASAPTVKP